MKILIAEDDSLILTTLKLRLKKDGHEVFAAEDGQAAIQQIAENDIDLIITDIMMPYNSGIEVLSFAKSKNKNIRVIILSGMGQENVVLDAFSLGVDDYMIKPFSPNELIMRVNRLLVAA